MNKCFLLGNLGADPELRYTANQKPVCSFNLATSKKYKDKPDEISWHKVVCYGNNAENCSKFLKKGSKVHVEGEIKYESWEKEGVRHYMTKIISYHVSFLDKAEKREAVADNAPMPEFNEFSDAKIEDIPF